MDRRQFLLPSLSAFSVAAVCALAAGTAIQEKPVPEPTRLNKEKAHGTLSDAVVLSSR